MAREFTLREVLPVANELDPKQGDIPVSLREKMAEAGYFGILIPEEYGGSGLGQFEYCIIAEELARGWMSVASLIARGNSMPGTYKMSEEKKRELLPRVARGQLLGRLQCPNGHRLDVAGIKCRAVLEGDEWVITGPKYWCTFADGADYLLVIARTEPDPALRHKGLSAFMVEKPRGELPNGVNGSRSRRSAISAGRRGSSISTSAACRRAPWSASAERASMSSASGWSRPAPYGGALDWLGGRRT